jgi:hypothetical protein
MAKKPTEKAAEKNSATSAATPKAPAKKVTATKAPAKKVTATKAPAKKITATKVPVKKTTKAKIEKKEIVKIKVEATSAEAISVETTHDVALVEEVKASKEDNKVAQSEFLDTFNWHNYQEGIDVIEDKQLDAFEKLVKENFVDTSDDDVIEGEVVYMTRSKGKRKSRLVLCLGSNSRTFYRWKYSRITLFNHCSFLKKNLY